MQYSFKLVHNAVQFKFKRNAVQFKFEHNAVQFKLEHNAVQGPPPTWKRPLLDINKLLLKDLLIVGEGSLMCDNLPRIISNPSDHSSEFIKLWIGST